MKNLKLYAASFLLLVSISTAHAQEVGKGKNSTAEGDEIHFRKGKLLYKDNFSSGLDNWIVEAPENKESSVKTADGKLVVDVNEGATIWFREKLSGNYMITYKRKVIMEGGKNDRLSDLNNFWMATDPRNENLFTRTGRFPEYDSLLMYYTGVGGNYNSTTRFRKYTGDGERVLHTDLQDKEHLLEPNKEYEVKIVVYNGVTKYYMDGEEYFSFRDPDPLTEGYFGFRTTKSRHEFDNFRVHRLK